MRAIPLFLLLVPGLLACRPAPPPDEAPGAQHLMIVLVDTLRRDALGCYGNALPVSPRIDALAGESFRFEQAIATSGWTLPSVGSLLTGTWPLIHGGMGKGLTMTPIRDELPTAAEVFRDAGYRTTAFVNAAFLHPVLRLDRGFELFDHEDAYNRILRRADATVDAALARLAEEPDRPSFTLVHLFDPHLDYDPPPGWSGRFVEPSVAAGAVPTAPLSMDDCRALAGEEGAPPSPEVREAVRRIYLEEVAFVDAQVGRLVEGLEALGVWERTTLVLTSDHGEELWEHGGFEHGHTLYDELIHVPLILRPARGLADAPGVIDAQVRMIDVLPTLFEIAGVAAPDTFVGTSLLPLLRGAADPGLPAFAESTLYGPDRLVWRSADWKFVYTLRAEDGSSIELYDLGADPGERDNLSAERPEVAERLHEELKRFLFEQSARAREMAPGEPTSLAPEHLESLRSLGYIR